MKVINVVLFDFVLFLIIICVLKVNSMSLRGPTVTSYAPCGLAIIQFSKMTVDLWRGVINFDLYPNLVKAEIELSFEREVVIYKDTVNPYFIVEAQTRQKFLMRPQNRIPRKYLFFVALNNLAENQTDVPVVTRFTFNNVTMCDDTLKSLIKVESLDVTNSNSTKYAHICGRRSLEYTELFSVETEAKAGEWPWHVAILIRSVPRSDQLIYECGGSIISRTAVVTAGHCVTKNEVLYEANRVVIIAGTSNRTDIQYPGRQMLVAEKVILHPSFVSQLATADLAVIKVNRIHYTDYVQPICLWGPVYDKTKLFGQQAMVVGFGATENNTLSYTLRSAHTQIQSDSVCLNYEYQLYSKLLNEFTFCAGYGPMAGTNPRNGDSGGGLVQATMQADNQVSWFLRGVLSKCGVRKGQTACDPSYYVVYTDVAPYYGWLYHHSGLEYRSNILH